MRILQITSHLNIGGIPRHVLSLSKGLAEKGHQVLIAADGGGLKDQLGMMGLTHWPLPFNTSAEFSPQVFWGMRKLKSHLRREPVDILHAHTRVAQVVADQIWHQLGIPYVTTWHGIYKTRLARRLWPCTGEMAIAISEMVRQHLLKDFRVPQAQIRRIYNGVDVDHYAAIPDSSLVESYRQRWQIPLDQPLIGGIGRLAAGRVKGFDLLLGAASLLRQRESNVQVLIVGEGPRRPFLEDLARRLRIEDSVYFVGTAHDIRIPLALMDVFVFTSRWPEAFGLTLVEAMAAGKPVVAVLVGAVPEIIVHGVSGSLVPPEDPSSLADAIRQLLNDRTYARNLACQAQSRVRKVFSLQRMVNEVEAVYEEVVK